MRWTLILLFIGCASGDDTSSESSDVVGGRPESGYAPVGYLHNLSYPQYKTWCGVTLLSPKFVVTASHCVDGYQPTSFNVGFGLAGSAPEIAVAAIHKHPSYVYRSEGDYLPWDDVAILELATEVTNIEPAKIARAQPGGCDARYVGYGRNVPGDHTITIGYDGERRSAQICLDAENPHELYIHGADGGLCWGDSGGPLLVEGTTRVMGVLSRHAPRVDSRYSCEDHNRMIFTSLATYHDFIVQWVPDAFEPDPPTTGEVGWCNVQWPTNIASQPFSSSEPIYGRVWAANITPGRGQGSGILAEVGFGPAGTAPDGAAGWIWYAAKYNVDADGLSRGDLANDEYMGTVFPYKAATYAVAYRFSVDGARTWKTCASDSKLVVAQ